MPSLAVALAVTVPLFTAVRSPVEFKEASPVPVTNDHVTDLIVALMGDTIAFN